MGEQQNQNGTGGEGGEHERPEVPNVLPQLAVVEVRRIFQSLPFPFMGGGDPNLGRSNFENRKLNEMVDLVESARPADLEDAGDALWRAGDAIRKASKELETHIGKVDWEGESGDAFRRWGKKLVANSESLAKYSESAATQIKAAGAGLATVQKAVVPLRDTRADPKEIKDIPTPARVEGNKEYDAAVKAEKDRQEAINQMNRLGSYYTVSQEIMSTQEPPVFEAMPDPGVPMPDPGGGFVGGSGSSNIGSNASASPMSAPDSPGTQQPASQGPDAPVPHAPQGPGPQQLPVTPSEDVSTDLDSVKPLAPPADPGPTAPPATPGPAGPTGPTGPTATPPMAPTAPFGGKGAPKTPGLPGAPRAGQGQPMLGRPNQNAPTSPVGRPGGPGPAQPLGRPSAPGQPGPVGRAGNPAQSPIVGRPTGVQAPGAPGTGRATAGGATPRPGRADGVVGGTPSRAGTPQNNPRIPRGTVVGGEGTSANRSTSPRTSLLGAQGSVMGAPPANSRRSRGRTGARESGGIVGAPRTEGGAQGGGGGFTEGGAGLVRGGSPSARERDREEGPARPDYLTEDEETWTSGRRGTVPPVVE